VSESGFRKVYLCESRFRSCAARPAQGRAATGSAAPGYPPRVHWLFTGLLVGVSGATAVYTLWLVRRLFTTAPAPAPEPVEQPEATP